jgi:hypothetical protein
MKGVDLTEQSKRGESRGGEGRGGASTSDSIIRAVLTWAEQTGRDIDMLIVQRGRGGNYLIEYLEVGSNEPETWHESIEESFPLGTTEEGE